MSKQVKIWRCAALGCGREMSSDKFDRNRRYCSARCAKNPTAPMRPGTAITPANPIKTWSCAFCGREMSSEVFRESKKYCTATCKKRSTPAYVRPVPGVPTGTVGAIGELMVCADLLSCGFSVFRSVSPHCKADLAIEKDGMILLVEVRTAMRYANQKIIISENDCRADLFAFVIHGTPSTIVYRGFTEKGKASALCGGSSR